MMIWKLARHLTDPVLFGNSFFSLLFWQSAFRVSNSALTTLLSLLKFFFRLLVNECPSLIKFSDWIPQTLRST